ncbi:protein of unknown function DUF199 [Alkaliphilus metalliredigens QYMF]|uniref:Probable cell division protein WhiA n=1 Tax=Alkaliphilus metalliredigens (strain QYMF) TaxID=293826 RepID=WHIA_ALKMQ|nr:DNA-binding protein WhiA [Alkaliphilus metalliredigens]A6TVF1.1 RecName: Full=Probable cell division protein WhiA [Alkaliphilus metalliredigens QYMF]ABR50169.1 protein of unknown function DUF199 [Alkaliphilus metalliredigens QYMF]
MSYSSNTKNELARIEGEQSCCVRAELAALIRMSGTLQLVGSQKLNIKVTTENPAIARRLFKIIKKQYNIHAEVMIRRNARLKKNNYYLLVITHSMGSSEVLADLGIMKKVDDSFDITYRIPQELTQNRCCKRAYLRGAFLGGGSVSDPEKTYHLEFVTHHKELSEGLRDLINSFDLNAKVVERKGNYVVYLKEGDQVVDLLNIVGAHSALLDLENIRVYKEMRNNVNRIVNCETANLSKTVDASIRQIQNIQYIEGSIGINRLPDNLREVAELRVEYQDATLKELGEMINPPIGKSGVNHRLRKLDQIADRERGKSI